VLAANGELLPDDRVWREGLADWVFARSVDGIFAQSRRRKSLWIAVVIALAVAVGETAFVFATRGHKATKRTGAGVATPHGSAAPPLARTASVDLSTPTRAAYALARAMEEMDADAVSAISVDSPKHHRLLYHMIMTNGAARKLEDAAVARFGRKGRGMSEPMVVLMSNFLDDGAVEKIDGDTATVGPRQNPDALRFRRIHRVWQFDVAATFSKFDMATLAQTEQVKSAIETCLLGGLAMITAGDFTDPADAHFAIQDAIASHLLRIWSEAAAPAFVPANGSHR
jgi:hypothetical protein